MQTVGEIQKELLRLKAKKSVYLEIVDWLETNFLPRPGGSPLKAITTDEKLLVQEPEIEAVLTDVSETVREIMSEIETLMGLQLVPAQPTQSTTPDPVKKRGPKASQGAQS